MYHRHELLDLILKRIKIPFLSELGVIRTTHQQRNLGIS
jgi:hypothetical protein